MKVRKQPHLKYRSKRLTIDQITAQAMRILFDYIGTTSLSGVLNYIDRMEHNYLINRVNQFNQGPKS